MPSYPVTLLGSPKFCVMDSDGLPMSGGKVYTYLGGSPGTSTPQATYSNKACTIPNLNPVILDGRGEATIYLSVPTKLILKTPADVEVWTFDNVGLELESYLNAYGLATQANVQIMHHNYGASAVGTDSYTMTLSPVPAALTNGMMVILMPDVTNTGACTLNVNGLGVVNIKKLIGGAAVDPSNGDILANYPTPLIYSQVLSCWAMTSFSPSTAWPIGSVFLSIVSTNPATLLGFGTWARIAEGQMLAGFKTGDPDFGTVEGTGGSKTKAINHTHTTPDHIHSLDVQAAMAGELFESALGYKKDTVSGGAGTSGSGGSATQDVLNPFFTVYIWKRTA